MEINVYQVVGMQLAIHQSILRELVHLIPDEIKREIYKKQIEEFDILIKKFGELAISK